MRQIVLDTETTGIDHREGHRIIEIGAVELIERKLTGNTFHQYIHPDREVPEDAIRIHGITNDFLADKPRFHQIVQAFMTFIEGAELIIHNAAFDIGHLNAELERLNPNPWGSIQQHASVTDTLAMAQKLYPGQRASLDALCKRLFIDNSQRTYHGALLDSQILADVYLAMTGGQTTLGWHPQGSSDAAQDQYRPVDASLASRLPLMSLTQQDLDAHQAMLARMQKKGACLWAELSSSH